MPDGASHRDAQVRRVLHVSPYIHPSAGGPPVVVERWAEFADGNGWHARVLSTPALSHDGERSLLAGAGNRYELSLVSSALEVLWGTGRAKVHRLVQTSDIVHLHTMWSPLNAVVAGVCRSLDKPYVISPHGMLDPYSLGIKALRKRAYLSIVESRTIRGATGVLFTAHDERDLAVAQIGRVPNPLVIGLGADAPSITRDELKARFMSSHPDLASRKLIIFLGRLHPKKRPETVIRAMAAVRSMEPNAALLIVGSGDRGYSNELRQLAADLGVDDCVHFLGLLTGDDKWAALAAAQLFVLPSHQENFAIAVAEALQLGVPVLITDRINIWREIIESGAGILLREEQLEADIAHHATALLSDVQVAHNMGSRARALALRTYSWAESARKLCASYDAILDARHSLTGSGNS